MRMASWSSPRPETLTPSGCQLLHAKGDVHVHLPLEAGLELAQGDGLSLLSREGAVVHEKEHGHRGLFDVEGEQGGPLHGGEANVSPMTISFGPEIRAIIAGRCFVDFKAFKPAGDVYLHCLCPFGINDVKLFAFLVRGILPAWTF